jgi:hypothetical protein
MENIWNISVVDKTRSHGHGDGESGGGAYSYRGTTSTSHMIKGFVATHDEKSYRDFPVDFEPQYGVAYYLLYAIYSTGDSFGHDEGAEIEYYGLFKPDEVEAGKRLMAALKANKKEYSIEFEGKSYHCPWTGYFESLDELELSPVIRLVESAT